MPDLYTAMTVEHAGDRERRFTKLFDEHYGAVLAYCRRRLGPDLADDAVAETFLAAWRSLDPPSGDDALPWLYSLARGAVANSRRRSERLGRLSERVAKLEPGQLGLDHSDYAGWQDHFAAAFAALSPADREVLRLVTWEGLDPAAGSVAFGCSTAAFKVRLHRARRRLRRLLDTDDAANPAPTDRSTGPHTAIVGPVPVIVSYRKDAQ